MILMLFFAFSLSLLAFGGAFEGCKYNEKLCLDHCCWDGTEEYCCSHCYLSTYFKENTNSNCRVPSWWDKNGDLVMRIGIPGAFLFIGGIVVLILICNGKIKISHLLGLTVRPPPAHQQLGTGNQTPAYTQATGVTYSVQVVPPNQGQQVGTGPSPVQPPAYTQATDVSYSVQVVPPNQGQQVGTEPSPVQPPTYTTPPKGSYPVQQPYAVSYPPMTGNPNFQPVAGNPEQ